MQREENYKKQLRRTKSAVETAPRFEAKVFKATYYGHTPVKETAGHEVIKEALAAIKKANDKPIKVLISVTGEHVQLLHRKTQDVLQHAPIAEVTFVALNPKDKDSLSYITANREGVILCHAFKVKKVAKQVHAALGEAFVAASEAAKRGAPADTQAAVFARQLTNNALNESASQKQVRGGKNR